MHHEPEEEIPPQRGYWVPQNFGGLPPEFSRFASARAVVLPVPYDLTTSYLAGTRHGPQAIIEASEHLELYDEELQCEPYRVGIHTLPPLEPSAASPQETLQRVEEVIAWLVDHDKFPVMLGGEHSLTLAPVRAFRKRFKEFSVLQLDAHADLRDSFQGTPFNHACVGRRIHELGVNLVQIGVRAISPEEAEFISRARNLHVCFDYALQSDSAQIEEALHRLRTLVYVTIDLDVFDPALMPAVGTPEPGGLDWYTVLKILRYVKETHTVLGFDVVELCPIAGIVGPNFLAAKLVYKMLGYFLSTTKGGQR